MLTVDQAGTDRYWNAIVGDGRQESQLALTNGVADPDPAARRRS